jgi:hypothetical protein
MLFGEEVIKKSTALEKLAEVVGSNPTRSTFIIIVDYGIVLKVILDSCQTKPVLNPNG